MMLSEYFAMTDAIQYSTSQKLDVHRNCIAIMVTVLGTANMQVNGTTIFASQTPAITAGDTFVIADPKGRIYKGRCQLTVQTPVGANPLYEVIQFFIPDKGE